MAVTHSSAISDFSATVKLAAAFHRVHGIDKEIKEDLFESGPHRRGLYQHLPARNELI